MYAKNLPHNVYHIGTVIDSIMIAVKNRQKTRGSSWEENSSRVNPAILMDDLKVLAIKPIAPPKSSWMMPSMGSPEG